MKIVYVAPFVKERYKGGIMRIAEYLSEEKAFFHFKENNINIEFFNSTILKQKKNSEGKFSFQNIFQALYLLFNLSRRVLKKDFDAIHFNSSAKFPLFKDQIIIFLVGFLTSKVVFFQIHFSGIDETFLDNSLFRKIQFCMLKRVHKIIVLSEDFKSQLIDIGIPSNMIVVLYNFHNVNIDVLANYNNSHDDLKLIYVGSISKRKGFHDLLFALCKLNINYTLNVLGDFSCESIRNYCNSFIQENELHVNFLGYIMGEEKNKIISAADVLVLPSYSEGFPMVIPEAMALACAIISTKIAGIPEIVQEGLNGYLIKPGEIDELARIITFFSNNRELLNRFKGSSVELSSNFTLENYILKLSTIYIS